MSLFPSRASHPGPESSPAPSVASGRQGERRLGDGQGAYGPGLPGGSVVPHFCPHSIRWEVGACLLSRGKSNPSRAAGLGRGHLFSGTGSGRQAPLPSPPSCSQDLSPLQPPDDRCIKVPNLCFQTLLPYPPNKSQCRFENACLF